MLKIDKATEILAKHWTKATGKPLDDTTKHHLQYAIDAINEALLFSKSIFDVNNLTKEEAIKAMREGHKVSHKLFFIIEWITMKDNKIVFDDGTSVSQFSFWYNRNSSKWNDGYYIVPNV